jgi:hypothetical protein
MRPVLEDPIERRASHEAALWPRVLIADRVVVGVEQDPKAGVKGRKIRLRLLEHEGFEEPGRVGEMPLRGARVGHRLCAAILRAQWRAELLGRFANAAIALDDRLARGGCGGKSQVDRRSHSSSQLETTSPPKQRALAGPQKLAEFGDSPDFV